MPRPHNVEPSHPSHAGTVKPRKRALLLAVLRPFGLGTRSTTEHLPTAYTKQGRRLDSAAALEIIGTRAKHNWGGWTRTTNFLINSQAVCQLTYAPSRHACHASANSERLPDHDLVGASSRTDVCTRSRLPERDPIRHVIGPAALDATHQRAGSGWGAEYRRALARASTFMTPER